MRAYYFKPRAEADLDDLRAYDDLEMIHEAVKGLAAGEKQGYEVPLQSPFLGAKEILHQYEVGRYKLNYTLTKKELIVQSVMV
jgi:hypothetical protein